MMQFTWPWLFLLLPLPWLLRKLLPRTSGAGDAALRVPFIQDFQFSGEAAATKTHTWPLLIYTLAWLCLLGAAARPQWIGEPIELPVGGRDLMMAIDLSRSMEQNFDHSYRTVSKLEATKAVATRFIDNRVGDRIGLILFGEQAYVQAPLTFDRTTVKTLLSEAVTGLAGNATAIGDAIGLAVKRLDETTERDKLLILLTDGVSNAGEVSPERAAQLAAHKGMKIHTIGVGNRYRSDLNETTLKNVASLTGGRYFRAHNTEELQEIYALIDRLEPVERDTRIYRPTWALFYWPLSAALILAAVLGLLRWRGRI